MLMPMSWKEGLWKEGHEHGRWVVGGDRLELPTLSV